MAEYRNSGLQEILISKNIIAGLVTLSQNNINPATINITGIILGMIAVVSHGEVLVGNKGDTN